jgi:hypothetical protein
VEAVEPQTSRRQPICGGRSARAAEGARRTESRIVEQHEQDVRGALRREQRLDRWECRVRVLGVVGRQATRQTIGDRQAAAKVPVALIGVLRLG